MKIRDNVSRDYLLSLANKDGAYGYVSAHEIINAPSTENKGEWIPVTERLPEENVHVLITVLHEGKTYVTTDDYFCYGFDDWKDDVIAWQPLPEPYKAESEDKE